MQEHAARDLIAIHGAAGSDAAAHALADRLERLIAADAPPPQLLLERPAPGGLAVGLKLDKA